MKFDLEIGLKNLKEMLQEKHGQLPEEFKLLENRLKNNLKEGRLFGENDPTIRTERNRITHELLKFTQEHFNISFNDLCEPRPQKIVSVKSLNGNSMSKSANAPATVPIDTIPALHGTKKRWAVVVGVGTYQDADPLPACVRDAQDISQQLFANGFQQEHLKVLADDTPVTPTRNNIITTLKRVARLTQPDDLLLFYYTGHGAASKKVDESYLITGDGHFDMLEDTTLPVSKIQEIMQNAPARAKVMIIDACRDKIDAQSKGPAIMPQVFIDRVFEKARGMVVLFSCDHGERSYIADDQTHSVYTIYLLEALKGEADFSDKGFVSVLDVHNYVCNAVTHWSNNHNKPQTPIINIQNMVGQIKVCDYKRAPTPLPPEQATEKPPSPPQTPHPLSIRTKSWKETHTVIIQDNGRERNYMLLDAPVKERLFENGSAIWREAKAEELDTHNHLPVLLKQVSISKPTDSGNTLRDILIKEYRLLLEVKPQNIFPPAFLIDESDSTISHITLVYDALIGKSLRETFGLSDQPLGQHDIAQLLRKIIPLCRALGELHRHNYAHRSLSPDTIIIPERSRGARLQDAGLATWRYKEGENKGDYQAPEQRAAVLSIPGPHTDVYQLGAILYFFITRRLLSASIAGSKPSAYNPAVSSQLDAILMRAVSTQPKERPNMYEFSQALIQAIR